MDQKLDSGAKRYDSGTNEGTEQKGRRLDLSVPQVAGSAVAAIAAAVGASQLDVYGTIIGAGVVSVIATCGGSVFHYLFRRTGEHLRDAADQARPRGRQVLAADGRPAPAAGRGLPDTLDVLDGDYGEATTHRTKRRGWKRPVLGAVVVFLVAMICITGFELAAGHDLTGNARTTIGSVVGGGSGTRHSPSPAQPSTGNSGGGRQDGSTGTSGGAGPSTSPGAGDGRGQGSGQGDGQSPGNGGHTPSGDPTPSSSSPPDSGQTPSAPTPTPSTSAGSGVSGDGQSDPDAATGGANAPAAG
ncbi:hypothetical protein [Streptomyces sp. NBC_01497]|uniref:hypothetical protein n=1 Tax=Streptomyces sp. NBC_01497 TaxID=2903885 RepID=UPI002E31DC9C|nr:hypothetical protein [Streptomyces sp. NBC_01497]